MYIITRTNATSTDSGHLSLTFI